MFTIKQLEGISKPDYRGTAQFKSDNGEIVDTDFELHILDINGLCNFQGIFVIKSKEGREHIGFFTGKDDAVGVFFEVTMISKVSRKDSFKLFFPGGAGTKKGTCVSHWGKAGEQFTESPELAATLEKAA